ncbi:homeobox domain protein [Rhizoctonia solani AG-3 Rhs1AP]|uniref:Homeobox domain protein n=2 Tax=Rhizoctonia solani AG-3 TaxID=1086053 RepID=A0A074SE78_9AGAM|nr:homeobox domain protein [Rhizoctonia solani AG-3 Rhs1AP]KEP48297.1 homeobox domain protein [Rhizoctonia solani 123E]
MATSEPSFLEVAASIREVLQQNLTLAQQYLPAQSNNPPPLEQPPIQQRFIDFSQHVSSFKLPPAVAADVATVMAKQSHKYQEVAEQAHLRLIHDIYSSCDPMTAASLIPHARMARDAIYDRSVNKILEVANQLATDVVPEGSASDVEEASESETSSSEDEEDDEDEAEGIDEDAEEDENSPMKPGEEVPPLETKYLPIFEALHERGKVLTKPEKTYLVNLTGMTYRQITIWFQNRRRGELKEDMAARATYYVASVHSDQTSELSDDDFLEKKLSGIQPSDTTFNIRSWRLASAIAPPDARTPSFPPSPTKVGFTDVNMPRPESDDSDSDLTDSDNEESRSDMGNRGVPSLTTSSATFESSSEHGPATITSASSSQARVGQPNDPVVISGKGRFPQPLAPLSRPVKTLPPARRTTPPAPPSQQQANSQPTAAFNFHYNAPAPTLAPAQNPQNPFLSVSVAPPAQPQFVTSNERGLTVEMEATPPRSTITLQTQPRVANSGNGPTSAASPSSPVLQSGSPHSSSSPSPSGHSASSPRPAVKPLPRRTGCAPRPRPPPRSVPVTSTAPTGPSSARSSVVLPPSSNPSLAATTLGALLRPSIPPPSIPPEIEDRLNAMAGRMGVGASGSGARRVGPPGHSSQQQRPTPFTFGPASLPGLGPPPGVNGATAPALSSASDPHDFTPKI